jgi:putative membrane protein
MRFAALQGPRRCPWCEGHMGWWGGGMMVLWWVLIVGLVVLGVWWFRRRSDGGGASLSGMDRAETILRERLARGEIDEDTYRRQLAELRRSGG